MAMTELRYRLVRSARKTLAIQIRPDGEVIVRAPKRMPRAEIERFVSGKREWITRHVAEQTAPLPGFTEEELHALAQRAKTVIPARVAYYAPIVGVTYGNITIRHQRTRWGSCSSQGNLNFNCLLMLAPEKVIDYVVVHELCHRKEMNHSPKFWAEVERILPDYRERRRWLRENGQPLTARLNQSSYAAENAVRVHNEP